jgi:ribosomal protein S18 acetylase RimI-like enzyme
MTATIRLLTIADAGAFRDIRQRSLRDHTDMFTSTAEEWGLELETYSSRIASCPTIGAFDGNDLVGAAILGVVGRDRTKTRHKCEVWSVYTAPEVRRRGIARLMMERVIDEARRHGYEALVLTVASHNGRARRLYESLGFFCYGTEPRHVKLPDGRYIDDDLMQLDLI